MNEFSEDKLIEQTPLETLKALTGQAAVNPIRNPVSSNGARVFGELEDAIQETQAFLA